MEIHATVNGLGACMLSLRASDEFVVKLVSLGLKVAAWQQRATGLVSRKRDVGRIDPPGHGS